MDTGTTDPDSGVTVKKLRVDRQNDQEGARHKIKVAPIDENDMLVLTDNDEWAFRDTLEQAVDDGLSAAEAEAIDDYVTFIDSEQRGSVTPVPELPKTARPRKEWPVVPPGKCVSTRSIAKNTGE